MATSQHSSRHLLKFFVASNWVFAKSLVSSKLIFALVSILTFGTDTCFWLLSTGSVGFFPELRNSPGYKEPDFYFWKPFGCSMHFYQEQDVKMCGRRLRTIDNVSLGPELAFIGDSKMRELSSTMDDVMTTSAARAKLEKAKRPWKTLAHLKKSWVVHYKDFNFTFTMHWNPWLSNRTMFQARRDAELQQGASVLVANDNLTAHSLRPESRWIKWVHPPRKPVDYSSESLMPRLMVHNGGLWHLGYPSDASLVDRFASMEASTRYAGSLLRRHLLHARDTRMLWATLLPITYRTDISDEFQATVNATAFRNAAFAKWMFLREIESPSLDGAGEVQASVRIWDSTPYIMLGYDKVGVFPFRDRTHLTPRMNRVRLQVILNYLCNSVLASGDEEHGLAEDSAESPIASNVCCQGEHLWLSAAFLVLSESFNGLVLAYVGLSGLLSTVRFKI